MRNLIPKKIRKALDKEIPYELIPDAHRKLYEAAKARGDDATFWEDMELFYGDCKLPIG